VALQLPRTTLHEHCAESSDLAKAHVQTLTVAAFHLTQTTHPAGYRIPVHSHETNSMYFLLEGGLTEHFGRHQVDRRVDDLIFTPAGEPHSNVFHDRGGRCFFLEWDASVDHRVRNHAPLPAIATQLTGVLPWLGRKLYGEFRRPDGLSPLIVESVGLEIIAELYRHHSAPGDGLPPRWIRHARELLDAHFSEAFSLEDLGQRLHTHPVYLARMFRRYFGCSVGEYVRFRRIEFARLELSRRETPLAQIAAAAGFSDQSHFSRTFRALIGVTPSQYRAASARR